MAEYTKGPWEYNECESCIEVPTKCVLADVLEDFSDDELVANGRLMAAAPDLYEALKKLTAEASGFVAMADPQVHGIRVLKLRITEARAALAKADGTEVQDA